MGVSIWEGKKAEELIEAVKNNSIPVPVKRALLDIAQNVVYQNPNGQTYYNNLYNALFNDQPEPVDPTLLYSLDEPVSVQEASDAVNTGLYLGTDTSFTIVLDAVIDAVADNPRQRRLISSINNDVGVVQMLQLYNGNPLCVFTFNGAEVSAPLNLSLENSHRIRSVGRYNSSTNKWTPVVYIDDTSIIINREGTPNIGTSTNPLIIGASNSGSWPFIGTINMCNIYNRLLTSAEIESLIGISV